MKGKEGAGAGAGIGTIKGTRVVEDREQILTCCGHEVVDVFDDIDKGFVASVFDITSSI